MSKRVPGRGRSILRGALIGIALVLLAASDASAKPWSWLGVRIRDLSEQEMDELASRHGIREGFGVVIVEVLEDTPAQRAGLRGGDIVVALGDRPVTETRMLQRLIAATPVGKETGLTVLRPDGRRRVPVRLVTMPRPIAGERVAAEFGFVIRDPEGPAEPGGGRRAVSGAPAVAVVVRGSSAEKAGLEVGDVILEVSDQAVLTRDGAREALSDAPLDRPLRLTVRRGERHVSLTLAAPQGGA